MQSFTITIPLTITFAMGTPQTHCVKLEIPPLVVPTPKRHVIKTPATIPAKHPVTVTVNARTFIAPAAIARVLAKIEGGADAVELRPEQAARFCALVPEVVLTRDYGRKGHSGNLAWWRVV